MFIINLDQGFAPYGEGDAKDISRPFPSGAEVNFKANVSSLPKEVMITSRIRSSDDVMKLFLATDACRRLGAKDIHVFLPYIPYGRQDRVCAEGEAFSLKVFANLVNAQGYASVTMFDVHSDVTPAVINNSVVITNEQFVSKVLEGKSNYVIVAPDAGASKKVSKVANYVGYSERPVQCSKWRAVGGSIENVEIPRDDFEGKDVYIIDDICDGGATFTRLATLLRERNVGTVNLIVSHGIFSKGFGVMKDGGIDHIYVTDSWKDVTPTTNYVTEVKLCTIL